MSDGLPKLPGFTFTDPTNTKYHLNHTLDIVNGYHIPNFIDVGIGKQELDSNSVGYVTKKDFTRFDPSLIYGRVKSKGVPQFIPHFALYDKKCLSFTAFFKQSVVESPNEHYRIRHVNILYFLEDDTMTVVEPIVQNCGFSQGRLVKRNKIPKNDLGTYWHWKDLNVGIDISIFGTVYHTVNCDLFTKEFMRSQGIDINPIEDLPPDPYVQNRKMTIRSTNRVTPLVDDKLRRFLEYDGKILKFCAAWDDRNSENGELRPYEIYYTLADDTVSVKEIHSRNDGRDPFPLLLKKTKLPKDWKDKPATYPSSYLELSDAEVTEYYQPKDFLVGSTIFILGRRFLIYDCDPFTRNYFKKMLNIEQKPGFSINELKNQDPNKRVPPHTSGFGSHEDSLQSCFSFQPKRPLKDVVRQLLNASKHLRYSAELISSHTEDKGRLFLIIYSLADSTIKINEPPKRNSGHKGGKFLRSELITKPESDPNNPEYYSPADFYIGAVIKIFEHNFRIIGADLYVYRYIQANQEKFPQNVIENIRNFMYNQGFLQDDIDTQQQENETVAKKAEIDSIGKNLKEVQSTIDKCITDMHSHGSTYILNRKDDTMNNNEDDRSDEPQYIRQNPLPQETERYGINLPNLECRYLPETGNIISTECEDISSVPKPPCCLKKDCIQNDKKITSEEREHLYYENLEKKHIELCKKVEELKTCNNESIEPKHILDSKIKKKSVTFDEQHKLNTIDQCKC